MIICPRFHACYLVNGGRLGDAGCSHHLLASKVHELVYDAWHSIRLSSTWVGILDVVAPSHLSDWLLNALPCW